MSVLVIAENTVTSVHYRGTLTRNGEEFDNSEGREPLTFLVGHQQMIPGFETALIGKVAGDKVTVDLVPADAYGERDPQAVQEVPLSQLPDGVKVGDRLAAQAPTGEVIPLSVTAISDEYATLDMNHELAGESLTFNIEVIEVREASAEEVANSQVEQ